MELRLRAPCVPFAVAALLASELEQPDAAEAAWQPADAEPDVQLQVCFPASAAAEAAAQNEPAASAEAHSGLPVHVGELAAQCAPAAAVESWSPVHAEELAPDGPAAFAAAPAASRAVVERPAASVVAPVWLPVLGVRLAETPRGVIPAAASLPASPRQEDVRQGLDNSWRWDVGRRVAPAWLGFRLRIARG